MTDLMITCYINPMDARHWMHNVPSWLALHSKPGEKAASVFDRCYVFGGWQPLRNPDATLDKDTGIFQYPEDPPLSPLFKIEYNDEVIYGYQSELWGILQPDGSFEVARMD